MHFDPDARVFVLSNWHKIHLCDKFSSLIFIFLNLKQLRVYSIFKKWQNDDDRGGGNYDIFLDNFSSGLKNFPWYVFWLKKLKNDIKITLKPTGIKL